MQEKGDNVIATITLSLERKEFLFLLSLGSLRLSGRNREPMTFTAGLLLPLNCCKLFLKTLLVSMAKTAYKSLAQHINNTSFQIPKCRSYLHLQPPWILKHRIIYFNTEIQLVQCIYFNTVNISPGCQ